LKVPERLFLSWHTVDFHLRQIFLKLGIRSRVELTRLVLQEPADLSERTT
jgi:DNA-binding CsgD family transcriptional regulator